MLAADLLKTTAQAEEVISDIEEQLEAEASVHLACLSYSIHRRHPSGYEASKIAGGGWSSRSSF